MPIETLNPDSLFEPEHYAQVSIATGTRILSIAGQVAHDAQGDLVAPGDLEAQVEQAFVNVGLALAAASATFADVFKLTIYVTRWTLDQMPQFVAGYESERCPLWLWEEAILQGYTAFRFLQEHRRGRVLIDFANRRLRIKELPS